MMPQEIEVWYVLPALRKELAKELAKSHKQTEIAEMLGITKSAVSQYINDKRGHEIPFPEEMKHDIAASAKRIIKKSNAQQELYLLCEIMRKNGCLCDIHKSQEGIHGECTMCTK